MRITSKGQVTIPIGIREKLGLHAGTEVRFELDGRSVRLRKAPNVDPEFDEWLRSARGSATAGLSTDEIMRMTRGE